MFVFLHGFLGTKADFEPLFNCLPNSIERIAIDLPGHGSEPMSEDVVEAVKKQIDQIGAKNLVGYSVGGRLALALKTRYQNDFEKVVVLSGHPGLSNPQESEERWKRDQVWIERLQTLSINQFLKLWYEQPLFESLHKRPELLRTIIEKRAQQNVAGLISFFRAFSLAKAPTCNLYPNTLFVCGEEDLKFRQLYHTLPPFIQREVVPQSGHILPLENPQGCADAIVNFLIS